MRKEILASPNNDDLRLEFAAALGEGESVEGWYSSVRWLGFGSDRSLDLLLIIANTLNVSVNGVRRRRRKKIAIIVLMLVYISFSVVGKYLTFHA